jgi:putative aldouronate transport system permease protein
MLNEVKSTRFKRTIQTISYLPHFLSSVIVVGMLRQLLSVEGGLINTILGALGRDPIYFLGSSRWYRTYYTASSWWSTVGWSSIIYLASITGIDPSWYEAAEIDGANVFHKMWHVTIPSILPIIAIMLIFRIGQLLNVGYEKTLLLYSEMVYDVADIISTYVYREGIVNMKYSYTAAVDLFTSVVSLFLVLGSNYVVKKMGQEGIW